MKVKNMSFYRYHVFFCTNVREGGNRSCQGRVMRDYAKDRVKALQLDGPGQCRINSAGCLGRCDDGPVLVVYPDEVWYNWVDEQDIDEIIDSHLQHGRIVERLRIV